MKKCKACGMIKPKISLGHTLAECSGFEILRNGSGLIRREATAKLAVRYIFIDKDGSKNGSSGEEIKFSTDIILR